MLISIIIPLYNKAPIIRETIDSVLSQKTQDYELIVVDDGSTDNGLDIVRGIKSEKIKIFQKENGGVASARNYGVNKAIGDWVLFLDADDILLPNALNHIIKSIKNQPYIDIFTFNFYEKKDGVVNISKPFHANGRVRFPLISFYLESIFPRTGNTVGKRRVYLEEPYDETLRRYEDFEHDLRLMSKYRYYAINRPVFVYNNEYLSASHRRDNANEDYCCRMQPKGKSIMQQLLMYKLFKNETCVAYPEKSKDLYKGEFDIRRIKICECVLNIFKKVSRKIQRIRYAMVF